MGNKVKNIELNLQKSISKNISCRQWHSSIVIEGEVENWQQVMTAGKYATKKGFKGVVNRLTVKNLIVPSIRKPLIRDDSLKDKRVDVLVIGGGITGCAILRELSKWNISALLVEKEDDLAMHASSRNDGMVHPGIEPRVGSNRSKYNIRGNELYTKVSKELGVEVQRCGSNVMFDTRLANLVKPFVLQRGKKLGVPVRFVNRKELLEMEPNISDEIVGAAHFDSTGILSPYKMVIAYAENAVMNGMEVSLNTVVENIVRDKEAIIKVETNRGTIYPRVVINAAGVYADSIADMAEDQFFSIHPRKGQIIFIDKKRSNLVNGVIAKPNISISKNNTKGGGVVKTVDGNILIGPDAYEQPFKEDYTTDKKRIDDIINKQMSLIKGLTRSDIITYCAGTRAATYEEDFIVEKSEYLKNLVHVAGIQSPGFASAPAIAEEVEKITCNILSEKKKLNLKKNWNPIRKPIPHLSQMNFEDRSKLIKKRPDYGVIVCRCEEISKGEIEDALNSPIPINSLDAVKRRVRAGGGRCQGGFCIPHVMEIISEEKKLSMLQVTKKGNKSNMLVAETKSKADVFIEETIDNIAASEDK